MRPRPRQYALSAHYVQRLPSGKWQGIHALGAVTAENPHEAMEKLTNGDIDEQLPWDEISPDHDVTISLSLITDEA